MGVIIESLAVAGRGAGNVSTVSMSAAAECPDVLYSPFLRCAHEHPLVRFFGLLQLSFAFFALSGVISTIVNFDVLWAKGAF